MYPMIDDAFNLDQYARLVGIEDKSVKAAQEKIARRRKDVLEHLYGDTEPLSSKMGPNIALMWQGIQIKQQDVLYLERWGTSLSEELILAYLKYANKDNKVCIMLLILIDQFVIVSATEFASYTIAKENGQKFESHSDELSSWDVKNQSLFILINRISHWLCAAVSVKDRVIYIALFDSKNDED